MLALGALEVESAALEWAEGAASVAGATAVAPFAAAFPYRWRWTVASRRRLLQRIRPPLSSLHFVSSSLGQRSGGLSAHVGGLLRACICTVSGSLHYAAEDHALDRCGGPPSGIVTENSLIDGVVEPLFIKNAPPAEGTTPPCPPPSTPSLGLVLHRGLFHISRAEQQQPQGTAVHIDTQCTHWRNDGRSYRTSKSPGNGWRPAPCRAQGILPHSAWGDRDLSAFPFWRRVRRLIP